jgi:hypothetical protein
VHRSRQLWRSTTGPGERQNNLHSPRSPLWMCLTGVRPGIELHTLLQSVNKQAARASLTQKTSTTRPAQRSEAAHTASADRR